MLTRLAIFDLDGTLIDSIGDLADAMNAVPRRARSPRPSPGQLSLPCRRWNRDPGPPCAPVRGRRDNEYRRGRSADAPASTRRGGRRRPSPSQEIPELLVELHARQIRTTVLSNKPDFPTREIVGELFPDNPFAIVRGARDGVPLKPNPTSTLEIISELGVSPQQTVFVGDTPIDMATGGQRGNANGRRHLGVPGGRTSLSMRDADHIIDHPLELLLIVDGMTRGGCRS